MNRKIYRYLSYSFFFFLNFNYVKSWLEKIITIKDNCRLSVNFIGTKSWKRNNLVLPDQRIFSILKVGLRYPSNLSYRISSSFLYRCTTVSKITFNRISRPWSISPTVVLCSLRIYTQSIRPTVLRSFFSLPLSFLKHTWPSKFRKLLCSRGRRQKHVWQADYSTA